MKKLKKDDEIVYRKIFTREEVDFFGRTMGFKGRHHEEPNSQGSYLNQGLLTAILTNRIGGEYNILMYSMNFDFIKKVWTDEEMTCVNKVIDLVDKKSKEHILIHSSVYNPQGELVLEARLRGIVLEF